MSRSLMPRPWLVGLVLLFAAPVFADSVTIEDTSSPLTESEQQAWAEAMSPEGVTVQVREGQVGCSQTLSDGREVHWIESGEWCHALPF